MLTFTMVNKSALQAIANKNQADTSFLTSMNLPNIWRNTGYELAFTRYQDTAGNRGNDAIDKLAKEAVSLEQVHEFYPLVST
jgi:hypothetical protein